MKSFVAAMAAGWELHCAMANSIPAWGLEPVVALAGFRSDAGTVLRTNTVGHPVLRGAHPAALPGPIVDPSYEPVWQLAA